MKQENDIRIIIDTNLWISFLIGRKLSHLLDLLSYPEFHLVISSELIAEIYDVFSRPKLAKYYSAENIHMLLKYMKEFSLSFAHLQKNGKFSVLRYVFNYYLFTIFYAFDCVFNNEYVRLRNSIVIRFVLEYQR